MPNPPANRRAGGGIDEDSDVDPTAPAPALQVLDDLGRPLPPRRTAQHHCAACGTIGRLSLADPDPADERPVLRITWPGARLLCPQCREAAP